MENPVFWSWHLVQINHIVAVLKIPDRPSHEIDTSEKLLTAKLIVLVRVWLRCKSWGSKHHTQTLLICFYWLPHPQPNWWNGAFEKVSVWFQCFYKWFKSFTPPELEGIAPLLPEHVHQLLQHLGLDGIEHHIVQQHQAIGQQPSPWIAYVKSWLHK